MAKSSKLYSPRCTMAPLSLTTRLVLLLALCLLSTAAVGFHRRQNAGRILGGRISPAKSAWLAYVLYVWFILCPLLAADVRVARPLRLVLGSFAACMWLRGLIELFMLYVSKNWRPSLGMMHNLISILLMLGIGWLNYAELGTLTRPFERWTQGLAACVLASLGLETYYASAFNKAVKGHTTGAHGIWFATKGEPRFALIVRCTALCNLPFYGFLITFLGACFGLW